MRRHDRQGTGRHRSGGDRPADDAGRGRVAALPSTVMAGLACLTWLAVGCQPAGTGETDGGGAALDADSLKRVLVHGLEQHRLMDLDYVRAVPDSALRWAPYAEVRDYARQIEHIALDNARFTARALRGEEVPAFGDSAVYLNDTEELERLVEETYAYTLEAVREMSAEELLAETELFGEPRARWRVLQLMLQHADWTRGQLVPYLRLNGVEPPSWRPY